LEKNTAADEMDDWTQWTAPIRQGEKTKQDLTRFDTNLNLEDDQNINVLSQLM